MARTIIYSSSIRLFSICPCRSHRHLFVICSSFVRSLFVHCSSFLRSLFVFCSSFVRLLFVHFLSARATRIVFCSSHFSVTTLPLLGSSLRIGEYVTGERIFPSFILYLPVQLAPSFIHCRATVEPL